MFGSKKNTPIPVSLPPGIGVRQVLPRPASANAGRRSKIKGTNSNLRTLA
jgi:hypothetical protein